MRWFGWLEDRGVIEEYPLNAMYAAFLAERTGHPAQAERWADAVDRWQHQEGGLPRDAYTEAMAATMRAVSCRHGVDHMRAEADESARTPSRRPRRPARVVASVRVPSPVKRAVRLVPGVHW